MHAAAFTTRSNAGTLIRLIAGSISLIATHHEDGEKDVGHGRGDIHGFPRRLNPAQHRGPAERGASEPGRGSAHTGGVAPSRLSHTVRAAATGCAPAACSSGATAAQTLSSVCAYVNALLCEGVVFAYVLACNQL